ncbi:MAG: UDP-2,4-diacetamido-2,4,6-trideoxy-beta-L-altropyranose hydrolase [Prochlorococcus sp. SP3034]|nr:UDP-2,4-diacetamido-2,4,6-trideoxy-beta-L-altropyranose hydrolase [Prochlorococcus sp. SP3034]|tara:strand:+ start:1528 stop:2559 length:1032 start_codon:yes stop_codon:yes gene_type:complete
MSVVFRVDSSNEIGGGHLTRCINIANQLKKKNINSFFILRDLQGADVNSIEYYDHRYKLIKNSIDYIDDAKQTIEIIKEESIKADSIIVDNYEIDNKWENLLKTKTKKLIVIDDLANKNHNCHILVNQVYDSKPNLYDGLINNSCQLFLGSKYIFLRPEFNILRKKSNKICDFSKITDIHIFFSSNDKQGLTIKYSVLLLKNFPELKLHISVGNYFVHLKELKDLALKYKNISWIQNNLNIEEQMAKCQIAIGTPGMTTWERACLGIPSIQLGTKDFQDNVLRKLSSNGICKWLGNEKYISEEFFIKTCKEFFRNKQRLKEMREICLKAIDGKGLERVINLIL